MDFTVEIKLSVQEYDADIMSAFPDEIQSRFAGTAIHIQSITVTKDEE